MDEHRDPPRDAANLIPHDTVRRTLSSASTPMHAGVTRRGRRAIITHSSYDAIDFARQRASVTYGLAPCVTRPAVF